jgi:hypothetical protein
MDKIDEHVKSLGAIMYRDCIVSGKRLLSRHYFDKDDNKIAVFSVPTANLTVFDQPGPYLAHAGSNLSQPVNL